MVRGPSRFAAHVTPRTCAGAPEENRMPLQPQVVLGPAWVPSLHFDVVLDEDTRALFELPLHPLQALIAL